MAKFIPFLMAFCASFLFAGYGFAQQAVKLLKAKRDNLTKLWGYENKGEQEYWWKEAHSQGRGEEMMNFGMDTEWVISSQYTHVAKEFSEGLAGVELYGNVGFIDKLNRFVIEPQFEPVDKLEGFSHGLAVVKQGGKYGFINKKGEFVIPPTFDYAVNFGDDMLATVKMDGKYGAIDFLGDTIVPCHYLSEEGMKLLPIKNKEYKQAAKKVRVLYDDGFYDDIISELNAVSDSMANIFRDSAYVPSMPRDICIRAKGSLYGLGVVGNDTLWRFPPIVHGIQDIGEGYFKMIYRGKVGLADAYGRLLIPCEFEEIVFTPGKRVVLARADDCYPVEKGVGLFDIAGATILPCVLDSISPTFVGGRAFAEMLGVEGSVDKYGQIGDDFMEALLDVSVKGDGLNSPVAYKRLIALRPVCAAAHNNLGIFYLEMEEYKEGIRCLKLANKLAPGNEQIAENLEQAKADRKERRYNRVLNALSVAGAIVDVAATTVSNISGSDYSTSTAATVPTGTYGNGSNGDDGKKKSRAASTSTSDRDVRWMQANYQAQKRTYSNYESQLIQMKTYPEKYNDSQRRQIQSKMKQIRETIISHGGTCSKSSMETWRP